MDDAIDRELIATRLKESVSGLNALRLSLQADPLRWAQRQTLRRWQSERLAETHADLLASDRYHDAARFFLDELYGPSVSNQRDTDVIRVMGAMVKLLPARALAVLVDAIELDALSERLDIEMVNLLGATLGDTCPFVPDIWCMAYRAVGQQDARQRQLDMVASIGHTLDRLTRHKSIGRALALMRTPARLAGFGVLHSFLDRGFSAFTAMHGADEFLTTIIGREQYVLHQLFAGSPDPFSIVSFKLREN